MQVWASLYSKPCPHTNRTISYSCQEGLVYNGLRPAATVYIALLASFLSLVRLCVCVSCWPGPREAPFLTPSTFHAAEVMSMVWGDESAALVPPEGYKGEMTIAMRSTKVCCCAGPGSPWRCVCDGTQGGHGFARKGGG